MMKPPEKPITSLPILPNLGRYLLMCCGCSRFMGVDGKPLEFGRLDKTPGAVKFTPTNPAATAEMFAAFDSKEVLDESARKAGWRAEDGNHRCPDCQRDEFRDSGRRGAYVDRRELGI